MDAFVVVQALWVFLPAYVANMTPVITAKLFPKWSAPMDGGRVHRDGRRLMGPGKTWRGLVTGAVAAALTAWIQSQTRPASWDVTTFGAQSGAWAPVALGTALGLGTGAGDAIKSYFKRRKDRPRGAPWIPFDQLDFVIGGLTFAAAAASILYWSNATPTHWFTDTLLGDQWPVIAILVLVTPILHLAVNVIGYSLRLKDVPW